MILPNFLIIGAAKAGTTSLCYYLNQHPEVYISPEKEPRFFTPEFYTTYCNGPLRDKARRTTMSLGEYYSLFSGVTNEIAIGEASTEYIYFPETAKRIKQMLPNIKLIAILRDPAERAFSAFCYQLRDGCELGSFEQALHDEKRRLLEHWRPGWLYQKVGFYYEQLKPYFDLFDKDQIRVYLYEDLDVAPIATLRDIFRFLGVDEDFVPDLSRKNVSRIPRNQLLNLLIKRNSPFKSLLTSLTPKLVRQKLSKQIKTYNLEAKPTLSPEVRKELVFLYQDDILRCQDLLERDLSTWLYK